MTNIDNPITLEDSYTFSAPETLRGGGVVGRITATSTVGILFFDRYRIDDADFFEIDLLTGDIKLKAGKVLNFEDPSISNRYSFRVDVSSGGFTKYTQVTINVTDVNEAPVFRKGTTSSYSWLSNDDDRADYLVHRHIAEVDAVGKVVDTTTINHRASDVDGDALTFRIIDGNDDDYFEMTTNGTLRIKNAIDVETAKDVFYTDDQGDIVIRLKIEVSDGELTDTGSVFIYIRDWDDEPAIINPINDNTTATIHENDDSGVDTGIRFRVDGVDGSNAYPLTEDRSLISFRATSFTITNTATGQKDDRFGIFSIKGDIGFTATWGLRLKSGFSLDYEAADTIELDISVTDPSGKPSEAVDVTINVEDVDEKPEFNRLPNFYRFYEHKLKEGTSIIHNLGTHINNDGDGHLRYEVIFPNEDDGFFKVRGGLGHRAELYAAKDVDYETSTSHDPISDDVTHPNYTSGVRVFRFKIKVSQVNNANLYDEETVVIVVTDVNDEAPTLIAYDGRGVLKNSETPTGHITENAAGVDAGISFTISDADNPNVADYVEAGETPLRTTPITADSFTITGTQADKFTLVHSTGDRWKLKLKPREHLDHEAESTVILHIKVSDGAHESDVMKLRVAINDVIEPPVITRHNSGDIRVEENDAGAEIGYVLKLIERDIHDAPSFRITDSAGNDQAHRFEAVRDGSDDVGNTLWKLKLKDEVFLDYETDPNIALVVVANNGVSDSNRLEFTLNVGNVANEVIRFTIPENAPNQYEVGAFNLHEASDTSIYEITAGNDDGIFTIGTFSGVISVVDGGALDYEMTPSHRLTVTETIPGDPTITRPASVVINLEDVNDEEPDLVEVDSDGNFLDSVMLEENQPGLDTGYFLHLTDVDTSTIEDFTFTITSDDITDASEVFEIIYVSTDAHGVHAYKLKLQDEHALDYEAASKVRLKITANDGNNDSDSTTATINVGDVNDVAPVITASFQQPGGIVVENVMGAETGITLNVADQDTAQSDLRFALHDDGDGGIAEKLELVRRGDDWILKLKDSEMFDVETAFSTLSSQGIFSEITVTVSDGVQSHEDVLPLFINDANDNLPKLHAINDVRIAYIPESTAGLDTNIAFAISDADISQALSIQNHFDVHISGDQAGKFTFKNVHFGQNIGTDAYDVSSGNFWQLTLKDTAALVYDSTDPAANALTLQVHASDVKHSSNTIEVTINIIEVDDGLVFTQERYNAYVEENEDSGVVITVEAISDVPISDNLRYSITSGGAGIFSIDEISGAISLNGALDAESLQQYNLNVQATDGTKTATAMVAVRIIDVNEHDVVFGADAVVFAGGFANGAVSEATSVGRILATVTASDADVDAEITYSITAGNDDNFFAIDAASGVVRLARALDYQTTAAHQIQITASDGKNSATTNIDFSVTEADNQFPLLISISKNGAINENAIGADSGISFLVADLESANTPRFIIHGGQSNKFELVQKSAQSGSVIWALKLKDGAYLDYEEDARIELSITGDNGFQRTNSIDVSIDVVDAEPETYTISVAESAEIGDAVAVLSVFEVGISGITYSIVSGNDAGVFRLDGNTLRLASALDYEDGTAAKNYTIAVNVADGTTTRTATLNIEVADENDNAPLLSEVVADARGAVAENVMGADTGIALRREDADSAAVNDFEFSITSDDALDQSGLFEMVEDAGLWRLQLTQGAALDYEMASVIALDIKVNDGVADSDSIRVYVDVNDANDVAPSLTPIQRAGAVDENDAAANTGVQFRLADADSAVGDFTFSITDDDGLDQSALFGMAHISTDANGVSLWQLELQDGMALNYEQAALAGLNIKVNDGVADSESFYVVITVHDVDESIGLVGDLAGDVQESADSALPVSITGTIDGYSDPENVLPIATADAIVVKDADSGGMLTKTGSYGVFSFTPTAPQSGGGMGFGQWRYVLDGQNLAVRALNDGAQLSESFTLTYTLTSGGVSITRDEAITLTILGRDSDIYFVDAQGDKLVDAQGDEISVLGAAVHEFSIERGRDALNGAEVLGALMPKLGGVVDADHVEIALAATMPADVAQHFSVNADNGLVFTGDKDDVAAFGPLGSVFNVDLLVRAPQETAEQLAFHVAINLINAVDDGQAEIAISGSDGAPVNAETDLTKLDVGWVLTGAVTRADPDGVVGVPSWRWFHTSDPETTIGTGASYTIAESDRRKIIGVEYSYHDGASPDAAMPRAALNVMVPRLEMSVPDSEKDEDQTLVIPDGNNGAVLYAGNGADTILAGDGDDHIEGGLGDDTIDLEQHTQDQDEVVYRIGNRYNRDGADGIINFDRGRDKLIFDLNRLDVEANHFMMDEDTSLADFITYVQNDTPDYLSDDQFMVMLNFDIDNDTPMVKGLLFLFQDGVFFSSGRVSMPVMTLDFTAPLSGADIGNVIHAGGSTATDVLAAGGILKDLHYLDDLLGGAGSLGFTVSDML